MERFDGLNICSFGPIQVFCGYTFVLPWPKVLILSIIKEGCLYLQKKLHGTLEDHEKHKSLTQQIFPRFQ